MAGFSEEEIAAELKRRNDLIKGRDEAWRKAEHEAKIANADTTCIHCGSPMNSWEATDRNNPICDICL